MKEEACKNRFEELNARDVAIEKKRFEGQIKEWNIQLRSNKLFTDEIELMGRSKRFKADWKVNIFVQTL